MLFSYLCLISKWKPREREEEREIWKEKERRIFNQRGPCIISKRILIGLRLITRVISGKGLKVKFLIHLILVWYILSSCCCDWIRGPRSNEQMVLKSMRPQILKECIKFWKKECIKFGRNVSKMLENYLWKYWYKVNWKGI